MNLHQLPKSKELKTAGLVASIMALLPISSLNLGQSKISHAQIINPNTLPTIVAKATQPKDEKAPEGGSGRRKLQEIFTTEA